MGNENKGEADMRSDNDRIYKSEVQDEMQEAMTTLDRIDRSASITSTQTLDRDVPRPIRQPDYLPEQTLFCGMASPQTGKVKKADKK